MDHTIARLGLALAIGLLVGLERGWREREAADNSRTAGIRTFGLAGLLGGIFAALAAALDSSAVLIAGFVGFAAIFAWFSSHEAEHDQNFSVTGVVAALSVFALGALAVVSDQLVAAAGGAALAAVLASREMLHGMLRRLTWIELRSAIVLAAMTAIVLPLLPDRTVDPWGGLNPFEIWFFTVIVAAISFGGYVAVRLLGEARGLLIGSIAGAIVSSTAVTVALARMARVEANAMPLVGGAALAALVSILRVCAVVALLAPQVIEHMIGPAIAAGLVLAAAGAVLLRRSGAHDAGEQPGRNPFELGSLLVFAAAFALVSTVSAALSTRFGESGLLTTTAVSGAFDVDVAVLSVLRIVEREAAVELVGQAVLLALAANGLGRLFLTILAGPVRFSLPLAAITACAAAVAIAALLWLPFA
jgi:uncharacterized membrane protein (DUF4010 family)